MMFNTQGKNTRRFAITIPGTGTTTGTSIFQLLVNAGYTGEPVGAVFIDAFQPGSGGSQRVGFNAASARPGAAAVVAADFSTHGQYIAAGQVYNVPTEKDMSDTNLMSLTASTVSALAVVVI